jgi:hypothetical protein
MCRVIVIGRPSAAIAARRPAPEVTLENTPTVGAEYLCAASVQKAKPIADVATVFASRYREPRYKASLRMFLRALRVFDREVIATATSFTVL